MTISIYDIIVVVNKTHRNTLAAVLAKPTRDGVRWAAIENLIKALGGEVKEREGSRVAFKLNGVVSTFHRPHPKPTAKKGAVDAVRVFLRNAGVAENDGI